jgi:hypothetical protein
MARYTKTVIVNNDRELLSLPIGQWFKMGMMGYGGQYMGRDKRGNPVVRMGKFSKSNAKRNRLQRKLAN